VNAACIAAALLVVIIILVILRIVLIVVLIDLHLLGIHLRALFCPLLLSCLIQLALRAPQAHTRQRPWRAASPAEQ
jgi:hypothetical protein